MSLFRRISHLGKKKDRTEPSKAPAPSEPVKANGTATEDKSGSIEASLDKTKFVKAQNSYKPEAIREVPAHEEDDGPPATRPDVETAFEQFAQLIHASNRPLPTQNGDGSYLERDEPTGLWSDLKSLGYKDLKTIRRILESKASGQPQDDREYLMEAIIQLVSALPPKSKNRVELTSAFLDELWNGLQHPPLSYLGDDYKYRSADGSRNSYIFPQLGAANTPYARSVNPVTVTPGAPPDPFLIFDSLMARGEFKPNPNRVSSIQCPTVITI